MPLKLKGLFKQLTLIFFTVHLVQTAIAQSTTDTLIHLKDAVSLAEQNYHLSKAAKYEAGAAYENIKVVRFSAIDRRA